MNTTVSIQNLKCGGCENTIIKALRKTKRFSNLSIDVDTSSLTFSYENDKDLDLLQRTLVKLGYPVEGDKNNLGAKALSYLSCALGKMQK